MYRKQELIYIQAITPVHAGAGQGLELADMPIQREKHSNIPKIEASSLKGSIKHSLYNKFKHQGDKEELYTVFGPENGDDYASAIGFTDARVLFFPIKSVTNIFKLITCPYVIKRWIEDLRIAENMKDYKELEQLNIEDGQCISMDMDNETSKVILEEYVFYKANLETDDYTKKLKELFEKKMNIEVNRIVVLSDSDFTDLVTMYTEIITRNEIDVKTGAAKKTGLFTEEYLPAETILYFMVLAAPSFNEEKEKTAEEVINYFKKNVGKVFQVGGNATIGKGFLKRM